MQTSEEIGMPEKIAQKGHTFDLLFLFGFERKPVRQLPRVTYVWAQPLLASALLFASIEGGAYEFVLKQLLKYCMFLE